MKKLFLITAVSLLICQTKAAAITSQITYQGTLKVSGLPPPPGNQDMTFQLLSSDGQTPYSNIISSAVYVKNGLFSVALDFQLIPPNTWDKINPYIQVSVGGQALKPIEPVTATVYALVSNTVVDGSITLQKLNAATFQTTGLGLIPVGSILPYAGATTPAGWLVCDGSSRSRIDYANLFAAIGTAWGSQDGASFNLPDLQGRTPIGAGQGAGLTNRTLGDISIGQEKHALSVAEMPSHNHDINDPGHTHGGVLHSGGDAFSGPLTPILSTVNTHTDVAFTGITVLNNGGGAAHNIMQPSAVVNYIIKY